MYDGGNILRKEEVVRSLFYDDLYVFAMQCMSTLAVVKRETRTWKWPIIQFIYMTGLAYIMSLLVYHIFR